MSLWCCTSSHVLDDEIDESSSRTGSAAVQHPDPDEERRQRSRQAEPSCRAIRCGKLASNVRKANAVSPVPHSPVTTLAARLAGLSQESSCTQHGGSDSDFAEAASELSRLRNSSHIHPFGVPQGSHAASSSSAHAMRTITLDDLRDLNFPCFSPAALPAASSQLPIAVLVLESVDDSGIGVSKPSHTGQVAADEGPVRRVPNNLVPLYINSACSAYFSISNHKDYVSIIRKFLQRDPLLTFAVQKALQNLKSGESKSVSHVTPDPSGQTSTLFGMRITPCIWEDLNISSPSGPVPPGSARPSSLSQMTYPGPGTQHTALLIEHNMPYNAAEVMPRLMRDYAVLSHVPAILTLIDFQGKVLYQNASSLAYMGDLLSVKTDSWLPDGLLRWLFAFDLGNLDQMLQEVLAQQEWQGVVQVPASLRRFVAAIHYPTTVNPPVHALSNAAQSSTVSGSFTARHRDDMDLDFQIGNSFTTRGMAAKHWRKQQHKPAQFLINRASNGQPGPPQTRGQIAVSSSSGGGPLPPALSIHSNTSASGGAPGALVTSSGPSVTGTPRVVFASMPPVAEDVQPTASFASTPITTDPHNHRRFMSLLDKTPTPHAPRPMAQSFHRTQPADNPASLPGAVSMPHPLPDSRETAKMEAWGVPLDSPAGAGGGAVDAPDSPAAPAAVSAVDEDEYLDAMECYHEIHAIPLLDPVLDKQVIMLVQTDVTPRVELENKLADLTDAQLSMLEQLFPRHIIEYMLAGVPSKGGRNLRDLANTHEQVMVLFCDVVGFTSMSKEVEPSQVMHFLNELYEAFDALADEFDMYKLDIVGDCYIVVAGLIKEDQDGFVCVDEMDGEQVVHHAERIMEFAKAMLTESRPVLMPHNHESVQLRIGIHTGPLVSGLVGAKMPKFTLFGDTMNTASRMESTCRPGCIHVSEAFARLVSHEHWQPTGGVQVKGKGLMQTCLYIPEDFSSVSSKTHPESILSQNRSAGMPATSSRLASNHSHGSVHSISDSGFNDEQLVTGTAQSHALSSRTHATNLPLMTILTNLLGGADDDSPPPTASSEAYAPIVGTSRMFGSMVGSRHHKSQSVHTRASADGGGLASAEGGAAGEGGKMRTDTSMRRTARARRPSEGFALLGTRESGATSGWRSGDESRSTRTRRARDI